MIHNGLRNASRLSGVVSRSYHNSILSTPPEVKISTAEKLFAIFCIGGALFGIPMYMAPNFKNYAKKSD